MYLRYAKRLMTETDKRLLWKLAYNFAFKGAVAIQKHKRRLARGEFFPPFLYISIINSCNLRCQGCWVDVAAKQEKIEIDALSRVIREANQSGNFFFGIVGGEPFMHADILEIFSPTPRLLLPGIHQWSFHHRRSRRRIAQVWQRYTAHKCRGYRNC